MYTVDRTTSFWFWKKTYSAMAYWFEEEGIWCWEENDQEITDEDVRISLCEEAIRSKMEEAQWQTN